jgi:hypothetical protein
MKTNWIVLVVILAASMAVAQTATGTTTPRTTPFSKKPAATAKTKSSAHKAAPRTTIDPATVAPTTAKRSSRKKSKATAATAAAPKPAKPKAVKKPKPAAAQPAPELAATEAAPTPGRKRDPFISPVQARMDATPCVGGGGPRCLAVNEVVLRGIVKSPNGMIAVVENAAQRTYFLHENQAIYNGYVERITPESVIFKEHYIDNLGHDSQREVVKTVNAPVV